MTNTTREERVMQILRKLGIEDNLPAILRVVNQECRLVEEAERERTLKIINKGLRETGSPIRVMQDNVRNIYVKN